MRRELLAVLLMAACKRHDPPAPNSTNGSGPPPLADKPYFRVDVGPRTPCTAGATCEARVVLTALGDYHVNEKYSTKLVVDGSPGVELQPATFALDSATVGTMTVPYRAAKPGTRKVTGTFRLSVCNDQTCRTEEPKIAFDVVAN